MPMTDAEQRFIADPHDALEGRWDDYEDFLNTYYRDAIAELYQRYPREQSSLVIDWRDISRWDPDVADDVRDHPELLARMFELVLDDVDMPINQDISNATVRFTGTPTPLNVSELRGGHAEKLLGVRGQVTKTSGIEPRVTVANFRCLSCGGTFNVHQPKVGVEKLSYCPAGDCGGQRFEITALENCEWVDHQLVRVKEPPEEGDGETCVDVLLTGDAAGTVEAGERADLYGILETDFGEFDSAIPEFYMDGHNVKRHESDYDEIDVGGEREEFEAIAAGERGDPYKLLIDSIAPSIKGGEKLSRIKLAIALQLFGGWRRPLGDGRHARGDSHIALIGDPGTGKSSLLEAAEEISPRSAYVSGKNTSTAGLTAAAVRDDFGDTEWSLEAGVIVKAHRGIACVDEIDKVDPDAISSLHTALEKQRLEVSKAGINASLRCQTALLAAGNPKYGRFDSHESDGEQLNLGDALATRFDLIFTLKDVPSPDRDSAMAEHIMKTRQLSGLLARGDIGDDEADLIAPDIPKQTLRAHIAYARQHCHPIIKDDEVHEHLREYFVDIRGASEGKTVPLTARKLDAILRLAEASARVRLSDEVTIEDIERAKAVVGQSLADVGINEEGNLDSDIANVGQSKPQQERVRQIRNALETAEKPLTPGEVAKRTTLTIPVDRVKDRLDLMKDRGEVIAGDDGTYRLV
jgi:replicative DNA helicase Mcm